ncbi:MAG: ABC transporter ATP-binding protein [Gammaproteobacteria bacterium]|nr:ABC transporter ATP-binding protein [Gammaproteobacteria bacterium]
MIELRDISKSYRLGSGWNTVLDSVSAVFPTGKSVGILGVNGAGKSTLLRIIGGVEPPDEGTVRKDIRVSWPMGFSGGFSPNMTGRQGSRFVARIYGESPRAVERYARDFAELGPYFDMPIRTYSSGMRARLAFAVSFAVEFDCYLVDEVIATGDARFSKKYRREFKERARESSVILVSHNPEAIRAECDFAAVLTRGSLTLYESVDEAMDVYEQLVVRQ